MQLEGFAEKSANDLYNTIQNCRKNVPLSIFIPACGITNIGFEAGKLLARKYKTFENISDIIDTHNVDSLLEINGNLLQKKQYKGLHKELTIPLTGFSNGIYLINIIMI